MSESKAKIMTAIGGLGCFVAGCFAPPPRLIAVLFGFLAGMCLSACLVSEWWPATPGKENK